MNILVYVGSRANYGRLISLLDAIIDDADLSVFLIEGSFKLPDKYRDYIVCSNDNLLYHATESNMIKTVALSLVEISSKISFHGYDAMIVHGDRYENIAPAICASYLNIPIFHIEAGDISGNLDNKVRDAITALSDVYLAISAESSKRINDMGYMNVYTVGSPSLDYAQKLYDNLELTCYNNHKNYILVLYNPCPQDNYNEFIAAVKNKAARNTVVVINPNTDPGYQEILKEIHKLKNVYFYKNLEPKEFLQLLYNCKYFMGNSSAGIKEAAFFGIPYFLVGDRQNGRELGHNVIRVACDKKEILKSTRNIPKFDRSFQFGDGFASSRIITTIKKYMGALV